MAVGISYSGNLAARLITALDSTFERWHVALNSARAGTYTADQATRDTVLQWSDYLSLLSYPGEAFTSPVDFVVRFKFSATANQAQSTTTFPNFGFTPEALALGPIPSAGHIIVTYDASSQQITVQLQNLGGLGLTPGNFSGSLVEPGNPMNIVGRMEATITT